MEKNSTKTKERILDAVGRLLATKGFQGIGVNAVAREAGVDKVLIYRYFENFSNLLKVFASRKDFWPTTETLIKGEKQSIKDRDVTELATTFFISHLKELLKRPTTQEIMRWELIQKNELTDQLCDTREEQGVELLQFLPDILTNNPEGDLPAAFALIHAGISYLILRSKTAQTYAGVDLHSEEGWSRIENAIQTLIKAYIDQK